MSALRDRVRVVVREVRSGKVGTQRPHIEDYVKKVFTLSKVEQNRVVYAVLEEIAGVPPRKTDSNRKPAPRDVLIGDDLVAAAAVLFKARPKATSREVYQLLVEDGRAKVGVSPASFMNGGYASRARVAAGVTAPTGLGGRPKAAKKAAAPAKKAATKKKSAGAAKRPSRATPPPRASAPEPDPPTPSSASVELAVPASDPVTAVPDEAIRVTADGDVVFLRVGGSMIEAHRQGDSWQVALSCTVPDDQLDSLVGLVWNREPS